MRYDETVAHMVRAVLLAFLVTSALSAYQPTLDLQTINEAIAIGQSRVESTRLRFHEPYRVRVAQAPVDYVDVVTPFRRVAIAAETHARIGERFGQREALALLGDRGGLVEFFIELTFHPQNAFLGVPPYTVHVTAAGTTGEITPRRVDRVPRYGARLEGFPLPYEYPTVPAPPAGSQPLLGGTLVVQLESSAMGAAGRYDLVVGEKEKDREKTVARLTINLATLR